MSQEISFIQDSDLLPTNNAIERELTVEECDDLIMVLDKALPIIRIDLAYIKIKEGLSIREENIGTPEEYPSNIKIPFFYADTGVVIKDIRYIDDASNINGLYYVKGAPLKEYTLNGVKYSMRANYDTINEAREHYFRGIPPANITSKDFVSAYEWMIENNWEFKIFIDERIKIINLYLNRADQSVKAPLDFSLMRVIYRGIIACGIEAIDFFHFIWGTDTAAAILSFNTRTNVWMHNTQFPKNIILVLMKLLVKHPLVYANIITMCRGGHNARERLRIYLNKIFIADGTKFGSLFLTPETKLIKGLKAESSQTVNALPYYKHNPCASTS